MKRKSKAKPSKTVVIRSASELASYLGLSAVDAEEWTLRSDLNREIVRLVKAKGLTHAQVARAAGTSRSRITAILNYNRQNVSTDLLRRIFASLGYGVKHTFHKLKDAA